MSAARSPVAQTNVRRAGEAAVAGISERSDGTPTPPASPSARLNLLREMIATEGRAVLRAAEIIDIEAVKAAEMTANCEGCVVVTGVGKAGLIGQKLVATLASTGTPAHFLHPTEAVHGDLGRVRETDLVWALSNSGASEEITRIAVPLRQQSAGLVALTADANCQLAAVADFVVAIGRHAEACPHRLAPTSSTAVMLAAGDAVALLASRLRRFTASDFARFHPGGALGRKLAAVDEAMRPIDQCRVVGRNATVRDAVASARGLMRRCGAVMVIDDDGHLAGLFTDSDLARLLESRDQGVLDRSIVQEMTLKPVTVPSGTRLAEAIALMGGRRISELPVIKATGQPLGLLDITDVVDLTDRQVPGTGSRRMADQGNAVSPAPRTNELDPQPDPSPARPSDGDSTAVRQRIVRFPDPSI